MKSKSYTWIGKAQSKDPFLKPSITYYMSPSKKAVLHLVDTVFLVFNDSGKDGK